MRASIFLSTAALALAVAVSAAPPEGKGGGNGGGGGDGGEDPPAETFVPAIAYFEDGRKNKDLRLANRAGDQSCLVMRTAQGADELRGFVYHAGSKTLAYSRDNLGIYLTTWGNNPCTVSDGTLIRSGPNPEFMDFSPDGRLLTWSEGDPNYTGFGSANIVFVYYVADVGEISAGTLVQFDLKQWGGSQPEWGVNGEWSASFRFTPDFATSNEVVVSGAPLDGSQGAYVSLFKYDLDETSAPTLLLDGADIAFDAVVTITNPGGDGSARYAFTNNNTGDVLQVRLSDGGVVGSFTGYEPAYSCDNSELIHRSGSGRKVETRITSADGTSTETWSNGNLRFFDWFCP